MGDVKLIYDDHYEFRKCTLSIYLTSQDEVNQLFDAIEYFITNEAEDLLPITRQLFSKLELLSE